MVESSRRERSSNERRNPSPLNTPRFFPREEGEKYFSSIPSSLLLSSFRFIRSPVGESTPENREALARNQATTRLEPKRRVERKLHPFPSNRINRGVLAAVDRGASSLRRLPRNLEMRNTTNDDHEQDFSFCSFRRNRVLVAFLLLPVASINRGKIARNND